MIKVAPHSLIDDLWPHFGPMLKTALEVHPFLSLQDVRWLIDTNRADLVVDTDGSQSAVMEVMQYPSIKVANVVALAGHKVMGERLHSLLDFCENWALQRQCDYFGMIGRPGWINFAASRGGHALKQIQAWKKLETPCLAAVGAM